MEFTIHTYPAISSTNKAAMAFPIDLPLNGHVYATFRQTEGRGLGTNRWESEPDKNLSFTLVVDPPHFFATDQALFSMAIALGCRDYVGACVTMEAVTVKWPNDIYIGEGKVCGILIETQLQGLEVRRFCIGIGMNINQREFLSDAPNPVSIIEYTHTERDLMEALHNLLEKIDKRLIQFDRDKASIHTDYLNHLYRREGYHRWESRENHQIIEAKIETIDDFGRLILTERDGERHAFAYKTVKYL